MLYLEEAEEEDNDKIKRIGIIRGNMKKITYIIATILGIASLFVVSCAKKDSSSSNREFL